MKAEEINRIREHLKNIWGQTSNFKCAPDTQLEINLIRQIIRKEELSNTKDQTEEEKWISVEDRLPKDGQNILVIQNPKTTSTKEPLFSKFEIFEEKHAFRAISDKPHNRYTGFWVHITHWQPLPSPPKE